MLIDKLEENVIELYKKYLNCMGMLSGLSSENDSPYINSRVAENIFCIVTGAKNLSRSDCSADAKYFDVGVGIKTFLANNNNTMQKVAEFNRDASMIRNKTLEEVVNIISELRNERILSTMKIYGLNEMIYHCIVREPNKIKVCEFPMDTINIQNIRNVNITNNESSIHFSDDKNEYSFNLNKNTLFKRFDTSNEIFSLDVEILDDPYNVLARILTYYITESPQIKENRKKSYESIILPLFSDRGERNVPEKSGLNQWNAGGRTRNSDEIYIPVPRWIHSKFPDFFPDREEPFKLILPDSKELVVKLCQDGSKALMSNPNLELGKWLLRDVMGLREKELLTYKKLCVIGIDSVEIYKINEKIYKIDFRPLGTYDEFLEENKS